MMKNQTIVQRHPVSTYFVLAFAISWVGSFIVIAQKFLGGESLQLQDIWLMAPVMLHTVSTLGVILTYIIDGKEGLRDLFSRMGRWRVGGRWFAALLIFPVLIVVTLFLLTARVSPDFLPVFIPFGLLVGMLAGFLEEIGWMGFAYPLMKSRYSVLSAALLLGVLHALWHFAPDYMGASASRGAFWWPHFLAFCVSMVAMRVILVWVYTNTKSLLMAQLMHASSTGFLSVLIPVSLTPAQDTLFYVLYAVVLWVAALVVIARYGKEFIREPLKTQTYSLQAKQVQR